jgi:DNA polymerase elongation subunit (family B)
MPRNCTVPKDEYPRFVDKNYEIIDVVPKREDYSGPVIKYDNKQDTVITMQIINAIEFDHNYNLLTNDTSKSSSWKYLCRLYGCTKEGHSVQADVLNYPPSFLIMYPKEITSDEIGRMINMINTENQGGSVIRMKKIIAWKEEPDAKPLKEHEISYPYSFIRVYFNSIKNLKTTISVIKRSNKNIMKRLGYAHLEIDLKIYDHYGNRVPHYSSMMVDSKCRIGEWIEMKGPFQLLSCGRIDNQLYGSSITNCQYHVVLDWNQLNPHEQTTSEIGYSPYISAYFDYEVFSSTAGQYDRMPIYDIPEDVIIQAGTTFVQQQKGIILKVMLVLKKCQKPPDEIGLTIIECENELDLLLKWILLIQNMDPEIITGYNIYHFDCMYLFHRLERYFGKQQYDTDAKWDYDIHTEILIILKRFSRSRDLVSFFTKEKGGSNSMGKIEIFEKIEMPGRVMFDMFPESKKDLKLDSYSLNNVSKEVLKDQKEDLKPKEMRLAYIRGTPKDILTIATYCMKDCDLCYYIDKALQMTDRAMVNSIVGNFAISNILNQGSLKLLHTVISEVAKKYNSYIQFIEPHGSEGFPGARVLKSYTGFYPEPIATLDFKSLYPNIMREFNISWDTQITDKSQLKEGDEVSIITYFDPKKAKWFQFIFKMPTINPITGEREGFGILPLAAERFLLLRANTRKIIKTNKGRLDILVSIQNLYNGLFDDIDSKILNLFKSSLQSINDIKIAIANLDRLKQEDLEKYKEYDKIHSIIKKIKSIEHIDMMISEMKIQNQNLNCKQLGYKVLANSLYGLSGAVFSMLYDIGISSSITMAGQCIISYTADLASLKYNTNVVYGDTDSIFVVAPTKPVEQYDPHDIENARLLRRRQIVEYYKKIAVQLTKDIQIKYLELDYEKVLDPAILFTKKRYAGPKFESNTDISDGFMAKGIASTRRGNTIFLTKLYDDVIRKILSYTPIDECIKYMYNGFDHLMSGKIGIDDLIITSSYTSESYTIVPAHAKVAMKMKLRDPTNPPRVGDRIGYVICRSTVDQHIDMTSPNFKKAKVNLGDVSEDPNYVKEHDIGIDYIKYVEKIGNQFEQIFTTIDKDKYKTVIKDYVKPFKDEFANKIRVRQKQLKRDKKELQKQIQSRMAK